MAEWSEEMVMCIGRIVRGPSSVRGRRYDAGLPATKNDVAFRTAHSYRVLIDYAAESCDEGPGEISMSTLEAWLHSVARVERPLTLLRRILETFCEIHPIYRRMRLHRGDCANLSETDIYLQYEWSPEHGPRGTRGEARSTRTEHVVRQTISDGDAVLKETSLLFPVSSRCGILQSNIAVQPLRPHIHPPIYPPNAASLSSLFKRDAASCYCSPFFFFIHDAYSWHRDLERCMLDVRYRMLFVRSSSLSTHMTGECLVVSWPSIEPHSAGNPYSALPTLFRITTPSHRLINSHSSEPRNLGVCIFNSHGERERGEDPWCLTVRPAMTELSSLRCQ